MELIGIYDIYKKDSDLKARKIETCKFLDCYTVFVYHDYNCKERKGKRCNLKFDVYEGNVLKNEFNILFNRKSAAKLKDLCYNSKKLIKLQDNYCIGKEDISDIIFKANIYKERR